MRVLVACEYSGRVREAFRKQGHTAWSADLLPADDGSLYHYEGDVRDILDKKWDLMVAHPPCTYLSNSGVRWLHTDPDRWDLMKDGADFFKELLDADIPKKAIENPIPHKYAVERIGRKYDQLIQPYQFGHKETKATCLWLQGLPKLEPTTDLKEETMALPAKERARIHHLPPSADRWKIRSTTYQGFADAMAEQWG
tara:strand:+ start:407 stop:997 length:591 start_codon:yes stop_codon:yes gene_type:complete